MGTGGHVSGLDGVRGLAVVAVVAYHLGFGWARGGYLGVDTFLVLSGYLITAGLLGEHRRTGRIGLRAFWARRARRLLPAMLVLLVGVALYAVTVALPDEARSLRLDALSSLAFVSNWRFILSSQGYFGQSAAPSLLRHTWSLGVEGQLYLVWPLLVVAVLGHRSQRTVTAVALGLGAGSAALAVALGAGRGEVSRAYYGTDTRAVAFLAGAAVAAWLVGREAVGRRTARILSAGAAVAVITTAWLWVTLGGTSPWLFRGGLIVAALATASVITAVVCVPAGALARALSTGPLRLLGRVSYGIYLWHWPIIVVVDHRRTGLSGLALIALRLGAIATATALSWIVVERPVLGLGPKRMPRRWQPALGAVLCAAVAAAVLVPASAGSAHPPTPGQVHALAIGPDADPTPTAAPAPVELDSVVLGDSVAVTVGNAMKPFGPGYHVALHNGAIVGCGVAVGSALRTEGDVAQTPGRCVAWQASWQGRIDAVHPDVVLVLLGRWEVLDRLLDGRWEHIGQPEFDAYLAGQLDRAIDIASSGGAAVVVCTAPYYDGQERPGGGRWAENDPARVDRFNQLVREAVTRHRGAVLYDLNAAVSPAGHFASVLDGVAVRAADGVHFSVESGAFLSPRLYPVLRRAATRDDLGPGPAPTAR